MFRRLFVPSLGHPSSSLSATSALFVSSLAKSTVSEPKSKKVAKAAQVKQLALRKASARKRLQQRDALASVIAASSKKSLQNKVKIPTAATSSSSGTTPTVALHDDDDEDDLDIKASLSEVEISAAPVSWSHEKRKSSVKTVESGFSDFSDFHSQLMNENDEETSSFKSEDDANSGSSSEQRMHELLLARMKEQQMQGSLSSTLGKRELDEIARGVIENSSSQTSPIISSTKSLLSNKKNMNDGRKDDPPTWLSPSDEPRYLEPQIERQTRLAIRSLMMYYHSCVRFSRPSAAAAVATSTNASSSSEVVRDNSNKGSS